MLEYQLRKNVLNHFKSCSTSQIPVSKYLHPHSYNEKGYNSDCIFTSGWETLLWVLATLLRNY